MSEPTIGELTERPETWNPAQCSENEPFVYIDIGSIDNVRKDIVGGSEVYPRQAPSRARQKLRAGDILVSTVRPSLNAIAEVPRELDGSTGSTGFSVLRPKSGKLDGRFLYYWVQNPDFVKYLLSRTTGANYPAVSDAVVRSAPIPALDFEEQRRIAAILDKADAIRRKREQSLALADDLLKSAFLEMFGSKTWSSKPLSEVVAEGTIVTYGIVQAGPEHPGGIPYIRTGDIKEGKIVIEGLRRTTPAIASKFARSTVRSGEIVMSIRATVGTTAVVPDELDGANLTQGTARISPGREVTPEYLLLYLRSSACQNWLEKQVKGATFREITLTRLRELEVPLPPLKLQKAFTDICRKVDHCQRTLAQDSRAAHEFFASLSQRAFRGEL